MARIDYQLPVKAIRKIRKTGIPVVQRKNPFSDSYSLYIQKPVISNTPKQQAIRTNFAAAAKAARQQVLIPSEQIRLKKIQAKHPQYKTLKGVAIAEHLGKFVK